MTTTAVERTLSAGPDVSRKLVRLARTLTPGERAAFGAVLRAARGALGEDVLGFDFTVDVGGLGANEIEWDAILAELSPPVLPPIPIPPRLDDPFADAR